MSQIQAGGVFLMKCLGSSHLVRRLLGSSCLVAALAFSGSAVAQTDQPANSVNQTSQVQQGEQQPDQPARTPDEAANQGAITVTGSRIQKTGYGQPTPVTVQTSEVLLASSPVSLAEGLNRLPQFLGSRTRTFCCEVGSQGNFLNLRGLGLNRTLVLLDSRRVVPTRETGDVDVNLLPELLIQRVDVVTGGASAAYGSDAVSGVVNYIIDNKFVGVKANFQSGISTYGDDASIKAAVAVGAAFAGNRGHIVLSVEHLNQQGITSLMARPTSNRGAFLGGNGTAAAPFISLGGVMQGTAAYGGVIIGPSLLPIPGAGAPLAGTQFLPGGATAPFVFGTPVTGSPGFFLGGDGILNNLADPAEALRTDHVYSRLSYDLTDNLTAWVRVNAGRSRTHGDVLADNRQTTVAYTIFRENPFLPASVGAAMDQAGVTSFRLARFNRDFGPIRLNYVNKTYDVAGGLNGTIGDKWKWEASVSHGETVLHARVENVGNLSHEYAQADAVRDSAGNIVCRVTVTNPGLYPGCVPINLFGEGSPSAAAKDYALGTSTQYVKNTLDVADLEVQGELFRLPAGAVSVAFGGEYRRRTLREVSNGVALNQIQATGIRGFPTALCPTVVTCRFGGWNQGNFGEANARDNVKEGFVETIVPLLKDTPFFHALDLNGAFRYTDYKNSGGVSTWKLGVSWSPIADLRLRGTRSRDIRAPNLFELFAGPVNAFQPGLTDPFTKQTNIIAITRTQGNPGLQPEKADTWTIGGVYTPSWLPGFSGSVDYYDINIKGALSATTSQATLDACFRGDQGACGRITRDTNQTIQQIVLLQINLNSRRVRGIDFDFSYNTGLLGGRIGARALVNHAISFVDNVGGIVTQQAGFYNTANQLTVPKWRGNFNVTYEKGPFSLFVQERYIGSYTQLPPIPGQIFAQPKIGSVFYTDLTVRAKLQGLGAGWEIYGTVNDLFNRKPPFIGNRFAAGLGFPTAPGLYDLDNRYFTVGMRVAF
jgi:outer membrane receptor protein involved in Fe transport